MYKSSDKRYTVPMKNAEASVRMEGCQVTPQMREQCQRVLRGEVTTAELLRLFYRAFPESRFIPLAEEIRPQTPKEKTRPLLHKRR